MNAEPKRYLVLLLILCRAWAVSCAWAGEAVRLKGSGASFPFPLYATWFKEYGKAHHQVIIDYQAKGRGQASGISSIKRLISLPVMQP